MHVLRKRHHDECKLKSLELIIGSGISEFDTEKSDVSTQD